MKKYNVVKPIYAFISTIYFGLTILIPIIFIYMGLQIIGTIMLVLGLISFLFLVIHNCYIKHIEVSEMGIAYKTLFKQYFLKWEEIKKIGVSYYPTKIPGAKPWIYITSEDVPVIALGIKIIDENFFKLNYRKNIILEIQKYCKFEIIGLDRIM